MAKLVTALRAVLGRLSTRRGGVEPDRSHGYGNESGGLPLDLSAWISRGN